MSTRVRPVTVNISDAAALLNVNRTHIYTLIEDGELTVYRIGRAPRIRVDEIERLLGGAPIQVEQLNAS